MEKKLHSLKNLGKARKKKRLTQEQLAEIVEKDLKTVRNWEQALSVPEFDTIVKLADLLECDIDYLSGRLTESTHDLQFIHDQTGLPEPIIHQLMKMKEEEPEALFALCSLIPLLDFRIMLADYYKFRKALSQISKEDISTRSQANYETDESGNVSIPIYEAVQLMGSRVSDDIATLCTDMIKGTLSLREFPLVKSEFPGMADLLYKANRYVNYHPQHTKSPDPATDHPDQESQRSTKTDDHSITEGSNDQ